MIIYDEEHLKRVIAFRQPFMDKLRFCLVLMDYAALSCI